MIPNKPIKSAILTYFYIILMHTVLYGQSARNEAAKDYINLPGPLYFDSTVFSLSWSSHATPVLFLQEYLPSEQLPSNYKQMLLVQVLADTSKLESLVTAQMTLLEKRKRIDQVVNYQVINNADKSVYILDFVISNGSEDINTIEWNAYRYEYINDEKGRKRIVLFGISFRDYQNTEGFLKSLPAMRKKEIVSLIHYKIPKIVLHKE